MLCIGGTEIEYLATIDDAASAPAAIVRPMMERLLQQAVRGKGKEGRWQDAFFGPSGSATERWRAVEVLVLLTAVCAYTTWRRGMETLGRAKFRP